MNRPATLPSILLATASAAVLLLLVSCGTSPEATLRDPLVVIGVDSADWTWIDALADQGRMPHWTALQAEGVRADLQSFVPLQKSPVIWTSIATGKRPAKHGIGGFTKGGKGEELTGSLARTAATYWEILGQLGRTQGVVGWWVTYPATPVNGILVSDYVQYFPGGAGKVVGSVWPDSAWEIIDRHRVDPESITLEDLGRFVDLEVARAHLEAAQRHLEELKWIYAADETFRRVARALYQAGAFDVFSVYFRGLDPVCHTYWSYFQPQSTNLHMQDWEIAMLKGVVPAYYEYTDELLGEVRDYVDPRSRILVMSDHGFAGHQVTPQGVSRGVQMHDDEGVFLAVGPGLARGEVLEKAHVLDMGPTLLALCGIPPAKDMDGRVLVDLVQPSLRDRMERLQADAVESYESLVPPRQGEAAADAEVDEKILERLRSLGYID